MKQACTIWGFTSDWVNSQTKNLSKVETEKENAKNFEEKDKVIPQAEIKREEKKSEVEQLTNEEKKSQIFKKEYKENDERNTYIQYAYEKGGFDLVLLMECENSTRNMYRQSEVVKNGRREPSFWFCMIDRDFHKNIVDDSRFRDDRKRQIDKCYELWKGWTKFYGPWRYIAKAGMKCSEYVKDRFTFN